MHRFLFIVAGLLLAMAWLSPDHYTPWLTFSSELFTFASALCMFAVYLDRNLLIPRWQWFWGIVVLIPIVQWVFGLELYGGKALLASSYLFAFGYVVVLGFNLAQQYHRQAILKYFSLLVFVVGLMTCAIALLQWFNLDHNVWGIMQLSGNRPYANFAQPNNMATFLLMSLMGAFYLFEKRAVPYYVLILGSSLLLFTIALSQSRTPWIACFVLSGYLLFQYSKDQYRLSRVGIFLWVGVYIAFLILVPYINQMMLSSGLSSTTMSNVVQRANSSHSRLGIWMQMLFAIKEAPWLGYGWNQTSIAQLVGADFWVHPERTNSAHDLVLELLVWNGVVVGGAILAYLTYWFYILQRVVKSKETVIASLMVIAVVLHMLLEFPQDYAYFLLPVAFLLGYIQSYVVGQKTITLNTNLNTGILVLCILVYGLIWRDYIVSVNALIDARKHTDVGIVHKKSNSILILDQFSTRVDWYYVNRFSKVSQEQLKEYRAVVFTTPSHYDLFKYAQLLAFNGDLKEAKHQLVLIDGLYQHQYKVEDLAKPLDHNGKPISVKLKKAV